MVGDIGSGKTSFMFGLVKAVGYKTLHQFSSPTFTILNQYETDDCTINHVDLYRLNRYEELESLDIIPHFKQKDSITFIEWGDKFKELEEIYTKKISFYHVADKLNERRIVCEGFGA